METGTKAFIAIQGGRLTSDLVKVLIARSRKIRISPPESQEVASLPDGKVAISREPVITIKEETVATACLPCALGHFSTSVGLLNEGVRFKGDGMASNEIADRIAKVLEEQNTLERVDLTPEKILKTPDWERSIAEEALTQSRNLRHHLETVQTVEELEQIAADTAGYYQSLHREWWKLRLAKLPRGTSIPPPVTGEKVPALPPTEVQPAAVIPTVPRPRKETDLEYLADSPEYLAQTIDSTGYRPQLESTFQEAIARIKGLK